MNIRDMLEPGLNPRGLIEFDEAARDAYVTRFIEAFNADAEEERRAELVYAIHLEIAHQHDLYIAVGDKLGNAMRKALHEIYTVRFVSNLGPSFK